MYRTIPSCVCEGMLHSDNRAWSSSCVIVAIRPPSVSVHVASSDFCWHCRQDERCSFGQANCNADADFIREPVEVPLDTEVIEEFPLGVQLWATRNPIGPIGALDKSGQEFVHYIQSTAFCR